MLTVDPPQINSPQCWSSIRGRSMINSKLLIRGRSTINSQLLIRGRSMINSQLLIINWGWINDQQSTVDQGQINDRQSTVDHQSWVDQWSTINCWSGVDQWSTLLIPLQINTQQCWLLIVSYCRLLTHLCSLLIINLPLINSQQYWLSISSLLIVDPLCWLSQKCIVGIPWCIMGNPLSSDTQLQVGSVFEFFLWNVGYMDCKVK